MVFHGNILNPTHKYYPIKLTIRESLIRYNNAQALDYYTFHPHHPVVAQDTETDLIKQLTKKPSYCLIMAGTNGSTIELTMYSSNIEKVTSISINYNNALELDPVAKLIRCHTSGTLCKEVEEYIIVPKPADKVLTEEDVNILAEARDQDNFMKGKNLVHKVFPNKEFKSRQAIKKFCATQINKYTKQMEINCE